MKPNTYVVMIVRYHIIYFVLWVPLCLLCDYSSSHARNLTSQIFMAMLWADLEVWSPMILEWYTLIQACTDGGHESRAVVQWYRAVYYRATPYHQHLGYTCQSGLRTRQYDVRGLCLLDFPTEIGTARDGLFRMMFQLEEGGRVKSFTRTLVLANSLLPHGSKYSRAQFFRVTMYFHVQKLQHRSELVYDS
jgi:hypothetical protein